mgnify:CR=1 FL=1
MGSFPKITEDGKAAIISIEGTDALLGKVDGLTLTGAVTLMLGNEVAKTGPVEMEAKGSEPKQFPGFTIMTGGTDVSAKWQNKGDPEVQVTIEGNLDAIIEVKATQGGKALKSSGSFFDDSWKTIQFGGSIEGKVTIEVTYWKDLKALKVPFTVALKP